MNSTNGMGSTKDTTGAGAHELDEFNLRLSDAFTSLRNSCASLVTDASQARIYHKDCRTIATSYGYIVTAFLNRRSGLEHAALLSIKQQLNRVEKQSKSLFQKCSNKRAVLSDSLSSQIGQIFEDIENCSRQLVAIGQEPKPEVVDPSQATSTKLVATRTVVENGLSKRSLKVFEGPLLPTTISEPDTAHLANSLPSLYDINDNLIEVLNISSSIASVDPSTTYHKHGGFGDVRRAFLFDGTPVAIKTLLYRKDPRHYNQAVWAEKELPKRFLNEVSVWYDLRHKNILRFLGVAESLEHKLPLSMVSPWMINGNITEYLKLYPTIKRLRLLLGIAEGIQFLHAKGVVHGDIKGPNVLISDSLEPILCDFGMAKFCETYDVRNVSTTLRYAGSTRYMAIELFWEGSTRTSNGSDMWAFGMTCVEIFTMQVPYHDCPLDGRVILNINNEIFPERPDHPECVDALWIFMFRCWNKTTEDRPTAGDAVTLLSGILQPPTYNVINHPLA